MPISIAPTAGAVSARPAVAALPVASIPAGTVGVCPHPGGTKPGKTAQAAPFDQLLGNLFQERGRRVELALAPHRAGLGAGDIEPLHRAREPHIGKAAFLAHLTLVGQRPLMRKQPVFQPGQENNRELQAFSGVQGHQGNHALRLRLCGLGGNLLGGRGLTVGGGTPGRNRVGICHQRDML